ncbi:MAG TPA: hypothetical protein PKY64_00360 [Anaerolineaceae bacterium]|nr:hypothetical protein [Anaerolineaceae bacterium]
MISEASLTADDQKKGTWVQLSNGWFAILMDNNKGNIRLAEVQGEYVEIGPIHSHDIVKEKINGEWVEVGNQAVKELNQKKLTK